MPTYLSRLILAPALICQRSVMVSALAIPLAHAQAETARSADAFVDTIGVNTHDWYDWTAVTPRLQELGIRRLRLNLGSAERYSALSASLGVRYTIMATPSELSVEGWRDWIKAVGPQNFVLIENINEPDLSAGGDWVNITSGNQQNLWNVLKADPATAGIPITGPSLTGSHDALGSVAQWLDYGNIHDYFGGRHPETGGWGDNGYGSMTWTLNREAVVSGGKPVVATETGYHNAVDMGSGGHRPTTEEVAAIYLPRLFLHHFNRGVVMTFTYEFAGGGADLADPEQNFGLLRSDYSVKPGFSALKNLIALTRDPGAAFTPGSLDLTFGGQTNNLNHTVLQQRDGTFILALWLGTQIYDVDQKVRLADPNQTITVALPSSITSVQRCLPNVTDQWSAAALSNNSVSVALDSRVVLLRLTSASAPVNQPPAISVSAAPVGATAPATITLTATASDSDGSVAKVEFFDDATKLGEDTSSAGGWSFVWSGAPIGSHNIAAKATDDDGASTTSEAVTVTVTAVPPQVGNGTGLLGTYFDNADFTGTTVTRTDGTVNFDWSTGSPASGIAVDTFSVRWQGKVQAQFTELYTFKTLSDDGVRLWVNGQQVINNWTDHGPTENSGTIALTAGQMYDISMEYFENAGGAVVKLSWSSPSTASQIIPSSQLYPAAVVPQSSPWSPGDIGAPGIPGSSSFADGKWTIMGSGVDIWGISDSFQGVHQPLTGDGEIVAHVTSQTKTDSWAKAGVMLRDGLAAGAKHASMVLTADNGMAFQRRRYTGGASGHTAGSKVSAPYWVKVSRQGSTFRGYESADGVTWRLVGTTTITMGARVEACLVVTSHDDRELSTAVFDKVALTPAGSG